MKFTVVNNVERVPKMKKINEYHCPICNYFEFREAQQVSAFFMDICPRCQVGKLEKVGQIIHNLPDTKK